MSDALLPPGATPLERALAWATAPGLPVDLAKAFNPDTCPAGLLPWLAHALSIDVWEPAWPEEVKRDVIRQSVMVHRKKGTRGAVRRMLAVLGHPDADIYERWSALRYDGSATYDGSHMYQPSDHWAEYRVYLRRPVTVAQAEVIRAVLDYVAPTRCHLKELNFVAAAHSYDGSITYDGTNNYGVA